MALLLLPLRVMKQHNSRSRCVPFALLSGALFAGIQPLAAQVPAADYFYNFEAGGQNSGVAGVYNLTFFATPSLSNFGAIEGASSVFFDPAAASAGFIDGAYANNPGITLSDDIRTVAFWMRAAESQTHGAATMFSQGFTNANGERFDLRLENGFLRLEIGGGFQRAEEVTLTDDCWHHVAVVVPLAESTMQDVEIYIDGALQTNINFGGNEADPINTQNLRFIVGDSNFASRDFLGYIDNLGYWNTALTQAEVQELWGNPMVTLFDSDLDLVDPGASATITVHFDPTATSATLDDGTTVTDLLVEDADGDGKVELMVMPTSATSYDLRIQGHAFNR